MFKLKDIMEMLNIPERTIRRHIKLGLLKGEKVGNTWRFSENDLHDYFSNKTIQQTQTHVKLNEIFDFLNGISQVDNQCIIIKQTKRLSLSQNKALSMYVSSFEKPFYFNLELKMNKTVIVFRGLEKNAIALLEKISTFE